MPDTDRIPSFRELDRRHMHEPSDIEAPEWDSRGAAQPHVKAKITEADRGRLWSPKRETREFVIDSLAAIQELLDSLPFAAYASVFWLAGTSIMMAAISQLLPAALAPLGMTLMFYLSIPISIIWWLRYRRAEQMIERLEQLQERIVELENALGEKLDVLVRNA